MNPVNALDSEINVEKIRGYVDSIRVDHRRLLTEKSQAKNDYEGKLKRINTELAELQKRCPHVRTEFHPDASGNNDSYSECLDCGKEDKRL